MEFGEAMAEAARVADSAVRETMMQHRHGHITDEDDITPDLLATLRVRLIGQIGGLWWASSVVRHRGGSAAEDGKRCVGDGAPSSGRSVNRRNPGDAARETPTLPARFNLDAFRNVEGEQKAGVERVHLLDLHLPVMHRHSAVLTEGPLMDQTSLLVFAAAYLAVLILPGPGVAALVARVLGRGMQGVPAFIAGFICGSLAWFTIAATGLAVLANSFAIVFLVVRYLGAAYLCYLAWKLWTASPGGIKVPDATSDGAVKLFLTGLSINLGNPKVIVFFLALLPTVVKLDQLTPIGFVELALIIAAVAGGILSAYALAAARARRMFTSSRSVRLINRGSSTIMAGTAVMIVAR